MSRATGIVNNCLHACFWQEEQFQPPWFTLEFSMKNGYFACPANLSVPLGQPNPQNTSNT